MKQCKKYGRARLDEDSNITGPKKVLLNTVRNFWS